MIYNFSIWVLVEYIFYNYKSCDWISHSSCGYKLAVTFTMQVTVGNYPFRTIY